MNIPAIPNAFEHVQEACLNAVNERYPFGVPAYVEERLQTELTFLKDSPYVDDYEIYRLLALEARKTLMPINIRGTVCGSFLIYLMNPGNLNPLRAHYYCEHCGHFETVDTTLFGVDLPTKLCPECNQEMTSDGFALDAESVWGLDGQKIQSFDYNIPTDFEMFAFRIIQKLYLNNPIVPYGYTTIDFNPVQGDFVLGGYCILPQGCTIDDFMDLQNILEDGTPCLSGYVNNCGIKRILFCKNPFLDYLVNLQKKTGYYIDDIRLADFKSIHWSQLSRCMPSAKIDNSPAPDSRDFLLEHFKPHTVTMMINLTSVHNTLQNNLEESVFYEQDNFRQFPVYCREDIFDHMLRLGFSREEAYFLTEDARMGRFARNKVSANCIDLKLPEAFVAVISQYAYIFPRAHIVACAISYMQLAYYLKLDSRAFASVMKK